MASKQITFESRAYPGLTVLAGGNRYRFAGGKLSVDASAADDVRKYAAARPHLGISEVSGDGEPTEQTEPTTESGGATMRMTKEELVALAESRGMSHDTADAMNKSELVEAINT